MRLDDGKLEKATLSSAKRERNGSRKGKSKENVANSILAQTATSADVECYREPRSTRALHPGPHDLIPQSLLLELTFLSLKLRPIWGVLLHV